VIRVERSGARLDVILADPQRRNAMTPETWRALADIGERPPVGTRVIVIRAEGEAFSSGLDRRIVTGELKPSAAELAALDDQSLDEAISEFQRAFTCWRKSDAIVIAAVQGFAIGAGFQLLLGCDLRVFGESAKVAMREVTLGLVPDLAGTEPLIASVGYHRALEICLTGRMIEAEEALALGLAEIVVPDAELASTVDDLVDAILGAPDPTVVSTKRLLAEGRLRTREEQSGLERTFQRDLLRRMLSL
jgi:enoyl-CoA hydratase/carnithine racemase